MKSKTSCFNLTIFTKNITHFWPVWLLYMGYLMVVMPVNIWLESTAKNFTEGFSLPERQNYIINSTMYRSLSPIPVFLCAIIIAMLVFSYLYSTRNANMIHAMPLNRMELYITNYVSGLLFMLIPELLAFAASVLVCLANQITCIQYLFIWLLYVMGMTFFAYTLAVFTAMFAGQIFAVPVYYLIVNFAYVGFLYAVNQIIGLISYGISDSWNPGRSAVLSPLYYLAGNVRIQTAIEQENFQIGGLEFQGGKLIAGYVVAAIILVLLTYQLYKRRKIETAGDFISIGVLKPVFRWGVALLGGVLISLMVTGMLNEAYRVNTFLCILVCIVFAGFHCFFGAEMLIQKNFRVFSKKRILEWAGFTVVAVLFISLFKLDVLGIERRLPELEEIETAFVCMDYPIQMETEELPVLLKLHQQVIESKDDYLEYFKNEDNNYYDTTFRYFLKDGTVFERRYPLPITEEYLKDSSSPSSVILELEKNPENMKRQILGIDYKNIEFYSGYIDLFEKGGDGRQQVYDFRGEEIEKIIDAIVRDIEAGNFDNYQLYSLHGGETNTFMNGFSFSYYNKGKVNSNWEYYHSYQDYQKNQMVPERIVTQSTGIYVNFGPECINVINTLKQMGIVNDTLLLIHYEEYEQMKGI